MKAKAGAAKEPDETKAAAPPLVFPDLDFDTPDNAATPDTPVVQDRDETADGRQRLKEVETRARTIFRERDRVMDKRRPFAHPRDIKVGQLNQAQAVILEAKANYAVLDAQAAELRSQIAGTTGGQRAQLQNDLRTIQAGGANLKSIIGAQTKIAADLTNQINALNIQIAPFDERLLKLWQELTETRKQWLELRQPMDKYARGDFEGLRRVLDDWLLIDGLWPNAFAWAALCSHELNDSDKAGEYLEKAQSLPAEVQSKDVLSQLAALTGLVTAKLPYGSEKARKSITTALRDVDKKAGWWTYFLVGRYYADRDRELLRAKANFETVLKIKPNCLCAKIWLARLQTTAADEKVRDLKAGTKTLEALWQSTGRRSWRLAYFLFEALHRSGKSSDAIVYWEKALELAPAERHDQLKRDYQTVMETK